MSPTSGGNASAFLPLGCMFRSYQTLPAAAALGRASSRTTGETNACETGRRGLEGMIVMVATGERGWRGLEEAAARLALLGLVCGRVDQLDQHRVHGTHIPPRRGLNRCGSLASGSRESALKAGVNRTSARGLAT